MLLAELIKEKEYLENSIYNLRDHISYLTVVQDDEDYAANQSIIEKRLVELRDLYNKLQQFSTQIDRTMASTVITINKTSLSLADAVAIKDTTEGKLRSFEYILGAATGRDRKGEGILCIDVDEVFKETEKLRLDIKVLESQIEFATWQTEVK